MLYEYNYLIYLFKYFVYYFSILIFVQNYEMKKISVGFRFDENIVDMLKHIAESDRRSQTATLEFLIESEYKKREKKK